MKTMIRICLAAFATVCAAGGARAAKPADTAAAEVTVKVKGTGPDKKSAKLDAYRKAVEKAVGLYVDAESVSRNFELVKDRVNTISNADIKDYDELDEGKDKDGLHWIEIEAVVEKKSIAPKFAKIFPDAFGDVGAIAQKVHARKVSQANRAGDAAGLMAAALENFDPVRQWIRLSVMEEESLEAVTKIKSDSNHEVEVKKIPGKGFYRVRYAARIDKDAYFDDFLPHFQQTLEKIQEGDAAEFVLSAAGLSARDKGLWNNLKEEHKDEIRVLTEDGDCSFADDWAPFFADKGAFPRTWFVNPVKLSGFPDVDPASLRDIGCGCDPFMFKVMDGAVNINDKRTRHIWILEKMNKKMTVLRGAAYALPEEAVRAYWERLFGKLTDRPRWSADSKKADRSRAVYPAETVTVEVSLLDKDGDELAVRTDSFPALSFVSGRTDVHHGISYQTMNNFNTFFVRPLFVTAPKFSEPYYSTEIRRDVYFPLTDDELAEVKRVVVRFGKSKGGANGRRR